MPFQHEISGAPCHFQIYTYTNLLLSDLFCESVDLKAAAVRYRVALPHPGPWSPFFYSPNCSQLPVEQKPLCISLHGSTNPSAPLENADL